MSNSNVFQFMEETKIATLQNIILPEFIEGIPTRKDAINERRELVIAYYNELWRRLQREVNSNYIFNDFWQAKIHIVKNESDKKTKNAAVKKWQSVYAVKYLYDVVKNARSIDNNIEFDFPKNGTQKKNGYKQMLILYYKFENDEYEYLNFMVKLTIGIKTNNKHVQYSVNSIDIK